MQSMIKLKNSFRENIKKLKNKTLIMISHKKNTIDYCDKVLHLQSEFLKIINERKKNFNCRWSWVHRD